MLEYFVDGEWAVAGEDSEIQTIGDYEYNVNRTGNNIQTLITKVFTVKGEIPKDQFKIRLRVSAPYTCAGNLVTEPVGTTARFRGVVSGTNMGPIITVVE